MQWSPNYLKNSRSETFDIWYQCWAKQLLLFKIRINIYHKKCNVYNLPWQKDIDFSNFDTFFYSIWKIWIGNTNQRIVSIITEGNWVKSYGIKCGRNKVKTYFKIWFLWKFVSELKLQRIVTEISVQSWWMCVLMVEIVMVFKDTICKEKFYFLLATGGCQGDICYCQIKLSCNRCKILFHLMFLYGKGKIVYSPRLIPFEILLANIFYV